MSVIARLICLLFLLLPGAAAAAPYPAHTNLFVNDQAGLLDADAEARLTTRLQTLKNNSGVEMTVLTLNNWKDYADGGQTFEGFATGLFNEWGVGASNRNDGMLVLISKDSHDIRIELGDGFDSGYSTAAARIIEETFVPAFRGGRYQAGIESGTGAIISEIALPNSRGLPVPTHHVPLMDRLSPWLFGAFAAFIVGTKLFGRLAGDWSYRFRRCPQCGQIGMHRAHVTGEAVPTGTVDETEPAATQTGLIVTTCLHCSYRDQRPWMSDHSTRNDTHSSSGGGSFGGGRSSGGGASGKW